MIRNYQEKEFPNQIFEQAVTDTIYFQDLLASRHWISKRLRLISVPIIRGGSRAAASSKMECFVIIVNGWKPLTIIAKCCILDVAAVLDPPLTMFQTKTKNTCNNCKDYGE